MILGIAIKGPKLKKTLGVRELEILKALGSTSSVAFRVGNLVNRGSGIILRYEIQEAVGGTQWQQWKGST